MEYLYVPTTTLNFNNILSTGSISPAAVYAARQFGYKQFQVVEPNPFRNVLLLYDRYPEFVLEDADRDNYPMVLRIRDDRLPGKLAKLTGRKDDPAVYACAETIYFDPTSVDLLFPSAQVQRTAMTKSEPSLTTKLVELFRPCMRVPSRGEFDSFNWSGDVLEGIKDGDKGTALKCCDADNRINRLKGFASGYIIGAYMSIEPKLARVRSHVRAIRNEASARLNDPKRQCPDSMRKDVEFSCATLESFFAEADIGTQRFDPQSGDLIRIDGGAIRELRDTHETGARSTQSLVQLVNDYCLASEFYGQLDEQRLEIAMEGAKAIRALIGDQWEGSAYQNYINALLNNIKSGSEFKFDASTRLAMQSFAAFILKGDDLQKLEAFLTLHGIGDFRIAFALWGAMFGFSKLPKTLYNLPIQQGEAAYAERMHAYVHSAVHAIPLHELRRLPPEPPDGSNPVIVKLVREIPQATKWRKALEKMLKDSGGLNTTFIKRLRDTKRTQVERDLGGRLGKGAKRADIEAYMERAMQAQSAELPESPEIDMPLFALHESVVAGQPMRTQFVDDESCAKDLRKMEDLPKAKRSKVAKSLQEFQKEYGPDGFYSSRPEAYQRDNANAVEHFINCLSSDKTKKLNVSLSTTEIEALRRWLRNRYAC